MWARGVVERVRLAVYVVACFAHLRCPCFVSGLVGHVSGRAVGVVGNATDPFDAPGARDNRIRLAGGTGRARCQGTAGLGSVTKSVMPHP